MFDAQMPIAEGKFELNATEKLLMSTLACLRGLKSEVFAPMMNVVEAPAPVITHCGPISLEPPSMVDVPVTG